MLPPIKTVSVIPFHEIQTIPKKIHQFVKDIVHRPVHSAVSRSQIWVVGLSVVIVYIYILSSSWLLMEGAYRSLARLRTREDAVKKEGHVLPYAMFINMMGGGGGG